MDKSAVFFTDFHVTGGETLPKKLHRLMKRAGFEQIDFEETATRPSRSISASSAILPICARSMPKSLRTMSASSAVCPS